MAITVEEKAKRYDEALKAAKDVYTYYCDDREQLRKIESIFPELKESKDEKIRKGLIGYFRAGKCENISSYHGISTNDILAWLEKQGKQKLTDEVEPKFHEGEWIITEANNLYQVIAILDDKYQLKYGGNYTVQKCADIDRYAKKFKTIL